MKTNWQNLVLAGLAVLSGAAVPFQAVGAEAKDPKKVQKIRLLEDDAQNYMVSKIYELKHQKANDLVPFVLGAIRRYAQNGTADRINYSAASRQLLAVSCPVDFMPYVDDMIAKLDRPSPADKNGSGIESTGISRNVYFPRYRGSARMAEIMIKAGIPSNATEGANQDATVAFDAHTNAIYWKDSINKDKDLRKYLAWLDRPLPQVRMTLNIYEVRESNLVDVGLDYLAWKNGPGLNFFDVGAKFLEGSAIHSAFGPYGFFLFAPSFDFSFLRFLQQNGLARIHSSAALTIVNGSDGELAFSPSYQNLTKNDKFASAVVPSANDKFVLKITKPSIFLLGDADKDGNFRISREEAANILTEANFAYSLEMKNVVERNARGDELYEASKTSGAVTVRGGVERLLAQWSKAEEIEQTIGIPFLCEIPILKYIFGTTTTTKENHFFFLSVSIEPVHPDEEVALLAGELTPVNELVNKGF